jgi:dynein assembly factor 5
MHLSYIIILNVCGEILERRQNIGCRTLVSRHLCKIVPALVHELEDWLVDIRLKASQLLYSLVLNAETHITHYLEKILDGMYRASGDEDTRVVVNVSFYCNLHTSTSLEHSK